MMERGIKGAAKLFRLKTHVTINYAMQNTRDKLLLLFYLMTIKFFMEPIS